MMTTGLNGFILGMEAKPADQSSNYTALVSEQPISEEGNGSARTSRLWPLGRGYRVII
jgi:hypothetical protein